MERHIILANLGNRNLKYQNKNFRNDEIPKSEFFTITKQLWETESEHKNLSVAILPAILEAYPEADLFLFTTRQNPVNELDTYYEGLLIEKLLKVNHYKGTIQLKLIDGINPTDESQLIPWYKQTIQQIANQAESSTIIVYETGGTPQQKSSLKAVAEFFFRGKMLQKADGNQPILIHYQGLEAKDATQLKVIEKSAYDRMVLRTEQRLLVAHYNYDAALLLDDSQKGGLHVLLQYGAYRWNNLWEPITKRFKPDSFSKEIKNQLPGFEWLRRDMDLAYENEVLDSVGLEPKLYRHSHNLISKAICQAELADYSGVLLSLHQFFELLVGGFIQDNSDYKIVSERFKTIKHLLAHVVSEYNTELREIFEEEINTMSFPVQIFYACKLAEQLNHPMLEYLKSIADTQQKFGSGVYPNKYCLDTLRNKIAHDGKGVTKDEYILYKPLIEKFFKKFNSSNNNPFHNLNEMINTLLLKSNY